MAGLDKDFLGMLETTFYVERKSGVDQWGNEAYLPQTTVPGVQTEPTTRRYGSQDGQNKKDATVVAADSFLVNYVAPGLVPGDRVRRSPAGTPLYVDTEQTFTDEFGEPLYQNISLTSEPRG